MSRSWSGRVSRRPQDQAAQAAQDGAVAAFLDLDTRQSYVSEGIDAVAEDPTSATHSSGDLALAREWEPIRERAFEASSRYLAVADSHSLQGPTDRQTGVDPTSAAAAFTEVHRTLAAAATEVDAFYRKHSAELEKAKSLRAATPKIAADARAAAEAVENELGRAEAEGVAYPSVQAAAGDLVDALSALKTADTVGSPLEIRHAAAARARGGRNRAQPHHRGTLVAAVRPELADQREDQDRGGDHAPRDPPGDAVGAAPGILF